MPGGSHECDRQTDRQTESHREASTQTDRTDVTNGAGRLHRAVGNIRSVRRYSIEWEEVKACNETKFHYVMNRLLTSVFYALTSLR